MNKEIKLRAVDFFCGAGGVTCGFLDAGIEVLGGIDIDSKFKDTYEKNNGAKFLPKDISNMPVADLKEDLGIEVNDDNLIFVGCSPCQYYSNIKSDKSKSKSGRLLLEDFKDFVLHYLPGFVFIENVPGLETKKGSPLSNFKRDLKKQGYSFDENVLNAKYFGVPQNRRRFVLIASRLMKGIELPQEDRSTLKSVRDAIGDYSMLPIVDHGHKDLSSVQHSVARLSDLNYDRVVNTSKNGGSRTEWQDNQRLQLECYKDHDGHYDVYGRLSWEKPSPTITTRFIYTSTGRYSHPEQNRGLSLREGALLQSFPYEYVFHTNNQGAIATMIGNAVPPKLAESIGLAITEHWTKWQHSKQKPVL